MEILKRLNRIELSQPEFEVVKDALEKLNTDSLAQFIAQATQKPSLLSKRWEINIQEAVRFYDLANERNKIIEAKFLDFLNNSKENLAVLVFGGFHSQEIKEALKRHRISYQIITPKIQQVDEKHQAYYKQLMSVGRHNFEIPANVKMGARPVTVFDNWNGNPALARAELRTMGSVVLKMKPHDDISILGPEMEKQLAALRRRAEMRTTKIEPSLNEQDQRLIAHLSQEYGWNKVLGVRTITGGGGVQSERLLVVQTSSGEHIIKRLKTAQNRDDATFLADYIHILQANGIPIPTERKISGESLFSEFEGKYYTVEKFTRGREISRKDALPETLKAVGRILGKIHSATHDFKGVEGKQYNQFSFLRLIDLMLNPTANWRQMLNRYFTEDEQRLVEETLLREVATTKQTLEKIQTQSIASDFNFGNMIFNQEGNALISVFDWDNARIAHRVEDFFPTLIQTGRKGELLHVGHLKDDLKTLLEGYEETAAFPLTATERDLLPMIFPTQLMNHFVFGLENLSKLDEPQRQKRLTKFRSILEVLRAIKNEFARSEMRSNGEWEEFLYHYGRLDAEDITARNLSAEAILNGVVEGKGALNEEQIRKVNTLFEQTTDVGSKAILFELLIYSGTQEYENIRTLFLSILDSPEIDIGIKSAGIAGIKNLILRKKEQLANLKSYFSQIPTHFYPLLNHPNPRFVRDALRLIELLLGYHMMSEFTKEPFITPEQLNTSEWLTLLNNIMNHYPTDYVQRCAANILQILGHPIKKEYFDKEFDVVKKARAQGDVDRERLAREIADAGNSDFFGMIERIVKRSKLKSLNAEKMAKLYKQIQRKGRLPRDILADYLTHGKRAIFVGHEKLINDAIQWGIAQDIVYLGQKGLLTHFALPFPFSQKKAFEDFLDVDDSRKGSPAIIASLQERFGIDETNPRRIAEFFDEDIPVFRELMNQIRASGVQFYFFAEEPGITGENALDSRKQNLRRLLNGSRQNKVIVFDYHTASYPLTRINLDYERRLMPSLYQELIQMGVNENELVSILEVNQEVWREQSMMESLHNLDQFLDTYSIPTSFALPLGKTVIDSLQFTMDFKETYVKAWHAVIVYNDPDEGDDPDFFTPPTMPREKTLNPSGSPVPVGSGRSEVRTRKSKDELAEVDTERLRADNPDNIESLELPPRVKKILKAIPIKTVQELLNYTREDLLDFRMFKYPLTAAQLGHIDTALDKRGLKLKTRAEIPETLERLGLSTRPIRVLTEKNIKTVSQLVQTTEQDLEGFRTLGRRSIEEIKGKLATKGLKLRVLSEEMDRIESLGLSMQAVNALRYEGIVTVDELIQKTEKELRIIRGLGERNIEHIKRKLGNRGLKLRSELRNESPQAFLSSQYKVGQELLALYEMNERAERSEVREEIEIQGPNGAIKWKVAKASTEMIKALQWEVSPEEAVSQVRSYLEVFDPDTGGFFDDINYPQAFLWTLQHVYDPFIKLEADERDFLANELLAALEHFPTLDVIEEFQFNEDQLEAWWYLFVQTLITHYKINPIESQEKLQKQLIEKHSEFLENILKISASLFKYALERGFVKQNIKSLFESRLYSLANSQLALGAVISELLSNWEGWSKEGAGILEEVLQRDSQELGLDEELEGEGLDEEFEGLMDKLSVVAESARQKWVAEKLFELRNILIPRSEKAIAIWNDPIQSLKKRVKGNGVTTIYLDTHDEVGIPYKTETGDLPDRWKFRLALLDEMGGEGFKQWSITSSVVYIQAFQSAFGKEEERLTAEQLTELLEEYLKNKQKISLRVHLGIPLNREESQELVGSLKFWEELWDLKHKYKADVTLFAALESEKEQSSAFKPFEEWLKTTKDAKRLIIGAFPGSFTELEDMIGPYSDQKTTRVLHLLGQKGYTARPGLFSVSGAFAYLPHQIADEAGWDQNRSVSFLVKENRPLNDFFRPENSGREAGSEMDRRWQLGVSNSYDRNYGPRLDSIVVTLESDGEDNEEPWVPEDINFGVKGPRELVPAGRSELRRSNMEEAISSIENKRILIDFNDLAKDFSDEQIKEVAFIARNENENVQVLLYNVDLTHPLGQFFRDLKLANLKIESKLGGAATKEALANFYGEVVHLSSASYSGDMVALRTILVKQGISRDRQYLLAYRDQKSGTLGIGLRDIQRGDLKQRFEAGELKQQLPDYMGSFQNQIFVANPALASLASWQTLYDSAVAFARAA